MSRKEQSPQWETPAATETTPLRLKGILRLVSTQNQAPLNLFPYSPELLEESQNVLQSRRRSASNSLPPSPHLSADFDSFARSHRYVCFFVVQDNRSNFYSQHCLMLRERLARDYHDVMSTFVVPIGKDMDDDLENAATDVFCQGTGFVSLPATPILLSLLNITQVPTVVVFESGTGQPKSKDAMLALEWNEPQSVINLWQRGKSGLTCWQTCLATATCQTSCVIS